MFPSTPPPQAKTIVAELEAWSVGGVDAIALTGPLTIFHGVPATYSWTGAEPNSSWFVLASFNANGFTFNGHSFDVGLPLIPNGAPLQQGQNSISGSGNFTRTAPASLAGRTVFLEIASSGSTGLIRDSNMLSISVL